jgi:hypothetical protein
MHFGFSVERLKGMILCGKMRLLGKRDFVGQKWKGKPRHESESESDSAQETTKCQAFSRPLVLSSSYSPHKSFPNNSFSTKPTQSLEPKSGRISDFIYRSQVLGYVVLLSRCFLCFSSVFPLSSLPLPLLFAPSCCFQFRELCTRGATLGKRDLSFRIMRPGSKPILITASRRTPPEFRSRSSPQTPNHDPLQPQAIRLRKTLVARKKCRFASFD